MSIYTDVQDSPVFKARALEFDFKTGTEPYEKLLKTFATVVKDDMLTWQGFDVGPPIALDEMSKLYETFVEDKLVNAPRAAVIFTKDRDALFTLAGTIEPSGASTPSPKARILRRHEHRK